MKFKPGQSGNPGGRPKGIAEVQALARKLTERCFEELERIAFTSEDERARLEAVKVILERAYGKAAQPVDGDGEGGPVRIDVAWMSEGKAEGT